MITDFILHNHGSIWIIVPKTEPAEEWLGENVINDETLFWDGGVVVEPRYVDDLLDGIVSDGLSVASA